jgi:hypothetical protein
VGSTYQLVVKVSVIDEIGLLAEYSLPATITVRGAPQVAALGQTFTPQPTFTPQVTFTPQPTFTQPATLIAAPTESEPSSVLIPSASQDLDRIILAVLGILIINLIGLSMFLLRTTPGRRFARQGVKAARTAVYRARTGIFQNREKAGQTIGTLTVQKGIKGERAQVVLGISFARIALAFERGPGFRAHDSPLITTRASRYPIVNAPIRTGTGCAIANARTRSSCCWSVSRRSPALGA